MVSLIGFKQDEILEQEILFWQFKCILTELNIDDNIDLIKTKTNSFLQPIHIKYLEGIKSSDKLANLYLNKINKIPYSDNIVLKLGIKYGRIQFIFRYITNNNINIEQMCEYLGEFGCTNLFKIYKHKYQHDINKLTFIINDLIFWSLFYDNSIMWENIINQEAYFHLINTDYIINKMNDILPGKMKCNGKKINKYEYKNNYYVLLESRIRNWCYNLLN